MSNKRKSNASDDASWILQHESRGGCRGGKANFSWESMDHKTRTFYVANSMRPSTDKANMGKDLFWWNKQKTEAESIELEEVRRQEQQLMEAALGGKLEGKLEGKVGRSVVRERSDSREPREHREGNAREHRESNSREHTELRESRNATSREHRELREYSKTEFRKDYKTEIERRSKKEIGHHSNREYSRERYSSSNGTVRDRPSSDYQSHREGSKSTSRPHRT